MKNIVGDRRDGPLKVGDVDFCKIWEILTKSYIFDFASCLYFCSVLFNYVKIVEILVSGCSLMRTRDELLWYTADALDVKNTSSS